MLVCLHVILLFQVLIETACSSAQLKNGSGGARDDASKIGHLPNPLATAEMRDKAAAYKRQGTRKAQEPFTVLDLACGRGGDFKKWVLQGADVYVGVDVSAQSVAECQGRADDYRQAKGKPQVALAITGSMSDHQLPTLIEKALAGHGMPPPVVFDLISCQFAIHYTFDSEESLSQLLANVSSLLAPQGHFIITSVDARCLNKHLEESSPANDFGNAVYRVRFSETPPAGLDAMGIRYTFNLSSAVEECDEYVIHMPTLQRLAKQHDLELIHHQNFGTLTQSNLEAYGHLLDPMQVSPVSADEWEAIQLYCAMVFKRL